MGHIRKTNDFGGKISLSRRKRLFTGSCIERDVRVLQRPCQGNRYLQQEFQRKDGKGRSHEGLRQYRF